MKGLTIGGHTLKVTYTDGGEAIGTFVIAKAEETKGINPPQTLDNIIIYVIALVLSIVEIIASVIYVRKKK